MYLKKTIYPVIAAFFALLIGSVVTLAHGGMEHVMGTVAALTDHSITVETVKHTRVAVLIDPSTKFVNASAQSSFKELKVGERVVIHAKENADKKLVGAEVKWGAGSVPMDKMEGMDHQH